MPRLRRLGELLHPGDRLDHARRDRVERLAPFLEGVGEALRRGPDLVDRHRVLLAGEMAHRETAGDTVAALRRRECRQCHALVVAEIAAALREVAEWPRRIQTDAADEELQLPHEASGRLR